MNKIFFSTLYFVLLVSGFVINIHSAVTAQVSLSNSGFEQWDSSNQAPPFDWHQPSDWSSTNPATEFNTAGITKSTDAHSGNFAARIITQNIFGVYHAGGLVSGHAHAFAFPDYTIYPITGGQSVTGKPMHVSGYYKFSSTSANDSALLFVINKKWNVANSSYDTIGYSRLALAPVSSYTLFDLDIADWDNLNDPDSIVVAFFSSNPDTAFTGTGGVLLVDDVQIGFTSSAESNIGYHSITVFPNPVNSNLFIQSEDKINSISVFNILGMNVFENRNINSTHSQIDVCNLSFGVYILEIKSHTGVERVKFLKD